MPDQPGLFDLEPLPWHEHLWAIGGAETLSREDLKELNASCTRVYNLMRDRAWHGPEAIRQAANGSEGLRRMRALRKLFKIDKARVPGRRVWMYRIDRPWTLEELRAMQESADK